MEETNKTAVSGTEEAVEVTIKVKAAGAETIVVAKTMVAAMVVDMVAADKATLTADRAMAVEDTELTDRAMDAAGVGNNGNRRNNGGG